MRQFEKLGSPSVHSKLYYFLTNGYNQGGLYLLSCLQKPLVRVNKLSQTYEKGIFYGAVLARGGIFLIEYGWAKKDSRWETIYGFSLAFFCF